MALDTEALRQLLCQRLCEEVRVQERPDGALMLRTNFQFPDGDRYPIHLCQSPAGGLRLSDRGHTLMHVSYEHDLDGFLEGTQQGCAGTGTAEGSAWTRRQSDCRRPCSPLARHSPGCTT